MELPPEYVELIRLRTARKEATALAKLGYRDAARQAYFKMTYGLTLADGTALAESQGNRCAICRELKKLVIDHDHSTGAIRGMLCNDCNLAVGKLGDNVDSLVAVLLYLVGAHR